jgi:hypothetical protein
MQEIVSTLDEEIPKSTFFVGSLNLEILQTKI